MRLMRASGDNTGECALSPLPLCDNDCSGACSGPENVLSTRNSREQNRPSLGAHGALALKEGLIKSTQK